MYLPASVLTTYYRPSKCALRTYLLAQGEPEEPPSPYEEVIERLGLHHEAVFFDMLPGYLDLSTGSLEDRIARTLQALLSKVPVLFHPVLVSDINLANQPFTVVGEPDVVMFDDGRHIVTECKIARRIDEKHHPEILRQIELYGWLYEQTMGQPPRALQVFSGTNAIVEVPYDGGHRALAVLEEIVTIRSGEAEPPTPVGWTWCGPCCFHERCWKIAERNRDVALVSGVDRGLALELYNAGVHTYDDLVNTFDEASLGEVSRPQGNTNRRVGAASTRILRSARAVATNAEIVLQEPVIPPSSCYVMFDLEGLPPQLDELEKVYLWGMQTRGDEAGPYVGVTAGFGKDGDREGWQGFLTAARRIFEQHGDVPFVHWAAYEKTKLTRYIERFGDPDGIAARVKANLLDLLTVTQSSIVLPLPSYSLKVVEKYVGFERTLPEANGNWSMAAFIEAVETSDESRRQELMDLIRQYNREDLAAMWAVQTWLRSHGAPG